MRDRRELMIGCLGRWPGAEMARLGRVLDVVLAVLY
jgi:hypothetical protein